MILKVENIKKYFGENLVLNNVSFNIDKGNIVSVIGPSGAGKTTLIRCINDLEDIDNGKITINDKILIDKDDNYKARGKNLKSIKKDISMVFQNFNLFPHMSVIENIIYSPIKVYSRDKEEVLEKAYEILEKLGLKDKKHSYPFELSGGQKQRVGIARALILNPKLICFDEPTSALDPVLRNEIATIIKSLTDNDRSVLVITHDMEFAKKISDRIIFMEGGEILKDDNVEGYLDEKHNNKIINFIS